MSMDAHGPGADPVGPPILVVDDEAFNRDLLCQELEDLGHFCRMACSGTEALEILRAEPVKLVLLDLMMPGMDGFAVLSAIRREERLRTVPVIVISALYDLTSVVRGIELGAVDHLPKPFEPALLKARIDASLERSSWLARERAYLAEIERQRGIADGLLETLLPDEAIAELKATGRVAPRAHEGVAVMFLDVVGFTELTLTTPPGELIEALDLYAETAEREAQAAGLEKIKMVGDAVMITGNLLRPHDSPVAACTACAGGLVAAIRRIRPGWRLRGGLAFGRAISGVIGRERCGFDLWGPAVNTAARLAGLPGESQLHLDKRAFDRLDDGTAGQVDDGLPGRPQAGLRGDPLGPIDLKGLGPVEVRRIPLVPDGRG